MTRRIISLLTLITFVLTTIVPQGYAQSAFTLPVPGTIIGPSTAFSPAMITGMTIHPENPLQFDFIVDTGDDHLQGEALKTEAQKMINYFLATLTVPEDEMWVNLSPFEKNRIIADGLSKTEMGRDMLAQDYLLKQLTASLIYPEEGIGKEFWGKVYEQAHAKFGTTDIPTDFFNKVWIVPQEASVYVHEKNVFVSNSHLKVMLEQDYLAMNANGVIASPSRAKQSPEIASSSRLRRTPRNDITTQLIREIILPAIEQEVNEGKNFATLRQIYNSMVLATWYKKKLKNSLLAQVYLDQNKTSGIELEDKSAKEKIYNQYLEAFKKGVYDYIKEDYDAQTQEIVERKYFSGGLKGVDVASLSEQGRPSQEWLAEQLRNPDFMFKVDGEPLTIGSAEGNVSYDKEDSASLGRVQEELGKIASDPFGEKTILEKRKWLQEELTTLNRQNNLFTPEEIGRVTDIFLRFFTKRYKIGRFISDGELLIIEDFGSGGTMEGHRWEILTRNLISDREEALEKKKLIYELYKQWRNEFRVSLKEDNRLALERFSREITSRFPHLRIVTERSNPPPSMIEIVIDLLNLFPDELLNSPVVKERLSGGIDLDAERHLSARIGHYDDELKILGIQPTIFDYRSFIETFLHEFGHIIEYAHLEDPAFMALFNEASLDMYALPALGEEGSDRKQYISRSIQEFFAETLMHYILHGDLMAQGFPGGQVFNKNLWKRVYTYYRDKVFGGREYRFADATSRPAGDSASLGENRAEDEAKVKSLLIDILGDENKVKAWLEEFELKSSELAEIMLVKEIEHLRNKTVEEIKAIGDNFEKELGISKKQLGRLMVKHPPLAGYDAQRVREDWVRELGIGKEALAVAIGKFPPLAGYNAQRVREDWARELGIGKEALAVAIMKHPPLASYNVQRVREDWARELGIGKEALAVAMVKFPPLAGLDVRHNLKVKLEMIRAMGVDKSEEIDDLIALSVLNVQGLKVIMAKAETKKIKITTGLELRNIYGRVDYRLKKKTGKTLARLDKEKGKFESVIILTIDAVLDKMKADSASLGENSITPFPDEKEVRPGEHPQMNIHYVMILKAIEDNLPYISRKILETLSLSGAKAEISLDKETTKSGHYGLISSIDKFDLTIDGKKRSLAAKAPFRFVFDGKQVVSIKEFADAVSREYDITKNFWDEGRRRYLPQPFLSMNLHVRFPNGQKVYVPFTIYEWIEGDPQNKYKGLSFANRKWFVEADQSKFLSGQEAASAAREVAAAIAYHVTNQEDGRLTTVSDIILSTGHFMYRKEDGKADVKMVATHSLKKDVTVERFVYDLINASVVPDKSAEKVWNLQTALSGLVQGLEYRAMDLQGSSLGVEEARRTGREEALRWINQFLQSDLSLKYRQEAEKFLSNVDAAMLSDQNTPIGKLVYRWMEKDKSIHDEIGNYILRRRYRLSRDKDEWKVEFGIPVSPHTFELTFKQDQPDWNFIHKGTEQRTLLSWQNGVFRIKVGSSETIDIPNDHDPLIDVLHSMSEKGVVVLEDNLIRELEDFFPDDKLPRIRQLDQPSRKRGFLEFMTASDYHREMLILNARDLIQRVGKLKYDINLRTIPGQDKSPKVVAMEQELAKAGYSLTKILPECVFSLLSQFSKNENVAIGNETKLDALNLDKDNFLKALNGRIGLSTLDGAVEAVSDIFKKSDLRTAGDLVRKIRSIIRSSFDRSVIGAFEYVQRLALEVISTPILKDRTEVIEDEEDNLLIGGNKVHIDVVDEVVGKTASRLGYILINYGNYPVNLPDELLVERDKVDRAVKKSSTGHIYMSETLGKTYPIVRWDEIVEAVVELINERGDKGGDKASLGDVIKSNVSTDKLADIIKELLREGLLKHPKDKRFRIGMGWRRVLFDPTSKTSFDAQFEKVIEWLKDAVLDESVPETRINKYKVILRRDKFNTDEYEIEIEEMGGITVKTAGDYDIKPWYILGVEYTPKYQMRIIKMTDFAYSQGYMKVKLMAKGKEEVLETFYLIGNLKDWPHDAEGQINNLLFPYEFGAGDETIFDESKYPKTLDEIKDAFRKLALELEEQHWGIKSSGIRSHTFTLTFDELQNKLSDLLKRTAELKRNVSKLTNEQIQSLKRESTRQEDGTILPEVVVEMALTGRTEVGDSDAKDDQRVRMFLGDQEFDSIDIIDILQEGSYEYDLSPYLKKDQFYEVHILVTGDIFIKRVISEEQTAVIKSEGQNYEIRVIKDVNTRGIGMTETRVKVYHGGEMKADLEQSHQLTWGAEEVARLIVIEFLGGKTKLSNYRGGITGLIEKLEEVGKRYAEGAAASWRMSEEIGGGWGAPTPDMVGRIKGAGDKAEQWTVSLLQADDKAMLANPGGIDFNAQNLNLQEQGSTDINFSFENLQNIPPNAINGILPVIINITPVTNLPFLLGLFEDTKKEKGQLSQL